MNSDKQREDHYTPMTGKNNTAMKTSDLKG